MEEVLYPNFLAPDLFNFVATVAIGLIVLWIFRLVRGAYALARLHTLAHNGAVIRNDALFAVDESDLDERLVASLSRGYLEQMIRSRDGSSALPVSHFVNPLLVHRSSIRIRTEGEERRATLSFSFDCLVPCSVRVYWGVPLKPLLWQLAAASEAEAPASEALEAKKPDEESEDLEMEPLRPPGRDDTDAEAERGLVARELGLLRPCEFTSVCSEERLSPGRVLQYVSRPHECPLLADRTDAWSPLCIAFHYPSTALEDGRQVEEACQWFLVEFEEAPPAPPPQPAKEPVGISEDSQEAASEETRGSAPRPPEEDAKKRNADAGHGEARPEGETLRSSVLRHLIITPHAAYEMRELYGSPFAPAASGAEAATGLETSECVVCLTEQRGVALLPCRHLCCCYACLARLEKCPICRGHIRSYLRFV